MTQKLLFILVVGVGLYYAIKHGRKAKKDIEEYEKTNSENETGHGFGPWKFYKKERNSVPYYDF